VTDITSLHTVSPLQWSRRVHSAEWDRFEITPFGLFSRFNGAAEFTRRNEAASELSSASPRRFNGAAEFTRRNDAFELVLRVRRAAGFNGAAEFTRRNGVAAYVTGDERMIASMEPPSSLGGMVACQTLSGSERLLQWSRRVHSA